MRRLYLTLVLVGCAQGAATEEGGGDVDAAVTARPDAPFHLVDAAVDAAVITPDAPPAGCTTTTSNLLSNGNFDTGISPWVEQRIDTGYPIVTNTAGPTGSQSGSYRAWLAGVETTTANNKDAVYQQIMVPATTTSLVLKGYYEIRTDETNTSVYDRATLEITSTTGTRLQLLKTLDDNGATTSWQTLNVPITANVKVTTIRMKLSTASDSVDATSFFFDTLNLEATYCQ
jgi:hypothetical protein